MEELLASQLELTRPAPPGEEALAAFFQHLRESGADRHFHPHPFTREEARARCAYHGKDVYCVANAAGRTIAYGMLRGWDEGYAVPSLGVAVHAELRGTGLGRLMMGYLHAEARRRGAARIRLKVHPDNLTAIELYRSLGYEFLPATEDGQLVGFKSLR